jgi:hypothetical protein
MKLKHGLVALLLAALALAFAGTAEAAPTVKIRSENAVVLQGISVEDVAVSGSPYGSLAVRLAVDGFPLDAPVTVVCDRTKACGQVRRGDRLTVKGALRVDLADGRAYVQATSLSLKAVSK